MPRKLLALNLLLGAVALGAAAFIVSEVTTPPQPAPLRVKPAPEPTAPAPPADKAPPAPAGAYAAVASRNLFSPTRTEAPVAPVASRPAATLPKPTLHGVVLRDGTPVAYLEDPTTKRVAGYRLGDSVAGGTVKAINADHVVLNRPEGALDVRLRDPSKPKPPPTAPAPAAQRDAGQREVPPPGGMPGPGVVTPPSGMSPAPQLAPGQSIQPGQVPIPPRRMLPPNVLRRVPPPASNATE
jgi:translation initiation factor IF-2